MKTILTIFLLTITGALQAQSCIEFSPGVFSGTTTEGTFSKYGVNANVLISDLGSNQLKISDFSAGYFDQFQQAADTLVLQYNCNGSVDSLSFNTAIGLAAITSGQYDSLNNTLTLHWQIPYNQIVEKSVFINN